MMLDLITRLFNEPYSPRIGVDYLIDTAVHRIKTESETNLLFICTHNSRRSHFCQIWTWLVAEYFGISNYVQSFSGGTEITALNERTYQSLKRLGFYGRVVSDGDNPIYEFSHSEDFSSSIKCYSKLYDDAENEKSSFIAVMTCDEANDACPYIPNAYSRISLPFTDPKYADGTPEENEVYDKCALAIGKEMFYLVQEIKLKALI